MAIFSQNISKLAQRLGAKLSDPTRDTRKLHHFAQQVDGLS